MFVCVGYVFDVLIMICVFLFNGVFLDGLECVCVVVCEWCSFIFELFMVVDDEGVVNVV